ncbi:L-rhamnose mutarotase [Occultella kanbiaonis]|uniref:L-rhamnose mutarotase n=1 Tax=Occultella kanbiaonis TaxID=2675754 RepID=UPI0013D74160|nr:L-rhamnose mutarotase [Occultella kanbiaonis]
MPRVCFISRVRPDRLDAYREAHAQVWPEMLEALRDTGWRDYSLYLSDDGLLVGHLETDDYAAAQEAMARTAVNPRWQAAMSQFFVDPGNPDEGFQVLDEVFHLEDQLRANGLPTRPAP